MTRVFLAISSSEYDDSVHLDQLRGAIVDGENVQGVFLDSRLGEYDASLSKLLVSPTLSEVHSALDEVLYETGEIDCFTLYFAGHGISHMGTYYLCVKDIFTNRLSTTALPINHIFNVINDKQPIQTNIIVDACEAGGVSSDLATLIKPEVFGSASSPSVSLFGACMREEDASEAENHGGIATQELLKYIKGDLCIDTRWPFLDIVQIGRNVSVAIQETEYEQTPVVWGLNLTGISTFSKNPHFQSEVSHVSDTVGLHTFLSSDRNLIADEREKIWLHYLNIPRTGPTPELIRSLLESVKSIKAKGLDAAKIGSFLLGTSEGLAMRVSDRQDVFSEIEVMACCGAAFLPFLEEENAEQSFLVLLDRILQSASRAFERLETDLAADPNALLSSHSGLSDLYILPIRIAKILGWMGLVKQIQECIGANEVISNQRVLNILESFAQYYALSFSCVTDAQAPYLMVFSQMQGIAEKNEAFLFPIRCFLNDFFNRKGKITRSDVLSGEDILTFLLGRNDDHYSDVSELIAQPSELLAVLFDGAALAEMDEVIDPCMISLDHFPLNIFLPEDNATFSQKRVKNGTNVTMQIGSEVGAGIFTLEDFRVNFANNCSPRIKSLRQKSKTETLLAVALSSFMMPDRVPWSIKVLEGTAQNTET